MRSWRWMVSRLMRLLLRWLRLCPRRGRPKPLKRIRELWSYGKLVLKSCYYNILTNSDTMMDCVFEPVYWLVDHMTRWFGVVFVTLVIALTGSVVIIVYLCVLPIILSSYPLHWILWHLCYGHWNLMMVIFHYYKATTTSPGFPPQEKTDIPMVTICKKCIVPKPARTHHCSICSSFCVFMTLGCIYCSISAKDMYLDSRSKNDTVPGAELIYTSFKYQSSYQTPPPVYTHQERLAHKCLVYLWVLTSSVAAALGALTLWHAALITRGETSVERHINRKERRRLKLKGKLFHNPYHHGRINNWRIFFGVDTWSDWLTRVLLPSNHLPHGDGLTWVSPGFKSSTEAI
ncbi:hypothetical protein DNTS_028840 [Danionella cerebrum]|uniref:Uncharacterized protein n=1 Tax=Danionella cerebrum TaxID=2873325 RepID=A0A553QFD9_9TELE|nr:hypothetical protein DNTS_028840 [Danionella translucida]